MSRRRYISTDVSLDKRLNWLATQHGDFAALLYTWMVPHAGDDGTLNGDLDEFIAAVIPMRREKSREEVQEALFAMCALKLITWDGKTIYFPVESFYRYQTYVKAENRRGHDVPMVPSEECRPTAENAEERRETPQNAASFSVSLSSSLSSSVSPSVTPSGSGGKPPRARKPELVPLTDEERQQLIAKWRQELPHIEDVIDLALEHEAHLKYPTGQFRYVDNWCRKEAERLAERRNGNGTRPNSVQQRPDDEDPIAKRLRLDAERERQPGMPGVR